MASMLHSQDGPDKFLLTDSHLTGVYWLVQSLE